MLPLSSAIPWGTFFVTQFPEKPFHPPSEQKQRKRPCNEKDPQSYTTGYHDKDYPHHENSKGNRYVTVRRHADPIHLGSNGMPRWKIAVSGIAVRPMLTPVTQHHLTFSGHITPEAAVVSYVFSTPLAISHLASLVFGSVTKPKFNCTCDCRTSQKRESESVSNLLSPLS